MIRKSGEDMAKLMSKSELIQKIAEQHPNNMTRKDVKGELRSCCFDRLSYAGNFVSCKVVHHDYIVSSESWDEALFDIGKKHFSVHRAVHHRRRHTVVTQRGHEGDGLPVPMRHAINQPHPTWPA